MLNAIGAVDAVTRLLRDPRSGIRIGAAIDMDDGFSGDEKTILTHAGSYLYPHGRFAHGTKSIFGAKREKNRPFGFARERRRQRLELGVVLVAVSSAHIGDDDADLFFGNPEHFGNFLLHQEGMLGGAPEGHRLVAPLSQNQMRFQRVVSDLGKVKTVLEDAV